MIKFLKTPLKVLDDFHGKKSSKRFWGNRLLTIGVFLALGLYASNHLILLILGQTLPIAVNDTCYEIIRLFFYTGGGLLFGGIFESYGKYK